MELVDSHQYDNTLNSDSAAPRHFCTTQEHVLENIYFNPKNQEGDILSPLFPDSYPKCVTATYYFFGGPGHRVSVTFKFLEIGDSER